MGSFFGKWLALAVGYLALAGSLDWRECLAGLTCGLVAMAWSEGLRRAGAMEFRLGPGDFSKIAKALVFLPRATWATAAALTLRPRVRFVNRGTWGYGASPASSAADVLASSLSPNSFVIRTGAIKSRIVEHAIRIERTS